MLGAIIEFYRLNTKVNHTLPLQVRIISTLPLHVCCVAGYIKKSQKNIIAEIIPSKLQATTLNSSQIPIYNCCTKFSCLFENERK
jgi:hypothetical protein